MIAAGGGSYVYANWYDGISYLTGPTLNLPLNRSYCLTFYYYVANGGRRDSSASLQVSIVGDGAGTRPDWSRRWWSSAGTGQWRQAEVSFLLRSPLQVVFAVNLAAANGSSVALDDISLASGDCSGGKYMNWSNVWVVFTIRYR
jgi:MAM domain, meprin/A5/mu